MEILRFTDPGFTDGLKKLLRKSTPQEGVAGTVREILGEVSKGGDSAVAAYTERFGGPKRAVDGLRETKKAVVDAKTRRTVAQAHRNVRKFAQKSLRKNWQMRNAQGALTGERFMPFERVGIYVPGALFFFERV
jgi:histidinol dehydrogenase